jgi:predicted Co/Zn/Cd cation transporter (cation efflux family)
MNTIIQYIETNLMRLLAALFGLLWAWVQPTLPFVLICAFAVFVDCVTAWRLNRRIRKRYTKEVADGKLKSNNMFKMVSDLCIIFLCVVLAHHIDNTILAHMGGLHMSSYVAAIFCLTQFVSILENESSCNGSMWAMALQKVLADKTERHIELTAQEFEKIKKEREKRDVSMDK